MSKGRKLVAEDHRLAKKRAFTRAKAKRTLEPPKGWSVVNNFDSTFVPCGCVTHRYIGIDCSAVAWTFRAGRFELQCLKCGHRWSRARMAGGNGGLTLDASHPEERAMLAAKRRERERLQPLLTAYDLAMGRAHGAAKARVLSRRKR